MSDPIDLTNGIEPIPLVVPPRWCPACDRCIDLQPDGRFIPHGIWQSGEPLIECRASSTLPEPDIRNTEESEQA